MKSESDNRALTPASITGAGLPSTRVREPIRDFQDSADLRDYLDVILRYKWIVSTFIVGVFVTTLVVNLAMKPVFKASGRIEVTLQAPRVTKFDDLVATQLQTREFIQTQVMLLKSESLAKRVIEKLHLAENLAFNPMVEKDHQEKKEGLFEKGKRGLKELIPAQQWKTAAREFFSSASNDKAAELRMERLTLQDKILDQFSRSLEVVPARDTTVIALSFSSTEAELSRDIINALIQEFIVWQVDKKIDAASAAKQQLEKQLELARIALEKSETNLKEFARKAGIVSLDSRYNLVYRELEEINKALAQVEAERLNKEGLHKQAQEVGVSALPMVVKDSLIQNLRQEHVKVAAEYREYSVAFKDDYPKLKNLKARMLDVERLIGREEMRILDSIKNDYLAALRREKTLREDAEKKRAIALELNESATQYKIFEREVEASKAFHTSLLERSKEIDAKVGTELGNIQVVDYASLPLKPYKPNVKFNLLVAIVVGLMGGVGIAFFLEYMDNTVKHVDEISGRFQLPILGVLPRSTGEELRDLDFLVRLKPRAGFSEAIRSSRVSIQLSNPRDYQPKSLLITSTSSGEGKSTIACNLAQAFASYGDKVVLIDGDLRQPRLHRVWNGSGEGLKSLGLSHYLSGICELDDVIQQTDIPNLSFIAAGPIPPNPSELLASQRMQKTLEFLEENFDRVIVDAPPAAGFADVLEMSHYVSAVVLVITLGSTHREALRLLRKSIHNVGGHLLGCIINKLDLSHHYSGYYYKYYKYYHSSYHRPEDQQQADFLPLETNGEEEPKRTKIGRLR